MVGPLDLDKGMLVILIVIQMTRSRGQSQLHNVLANRFSFGPCPSTSEVITKSLTTVDCLSSPENVTKLGGL